MPGRARELSWLAAPWVLAWAVWSHSWPAVCAAALLAGASWRPAPHGRGGAATVAVVATVAAVVAGERISSVEDIAWAALATTGLTLAAMHFAPRRPDGAAAASTVVAPRLPDLACAAVMLPMLVLAPSSRLLCGTDGLLAALALPLHVAAMFAPLAIWQGRPWAQAGAFRERDARALRVAGGLSMSVALLAMHVLPGDAVSMLLLASVAGIGWAATVRGCTDAPPSRSIHEGRRWTARASTALAGTAFGAAAVLGTHHGLGAAGVGAAGALLVLVVAVLAPASGAVSSPPTGTTGTRGSRSRRGTGSPASPGTP